MTQLEILNLTKNIKHNTLLEDITMSLKSNNIYALIGPNGAGKTTLFKCLLGLSHSTGKIYFDGEEITEENLSIFLRNTGVVFPIPDSYNTTTVGELFENQTRYYDCKNVNMREYLHDFGLTVSNSDKISELSLGMKQRLSIALALLHNPKLLILDEPFNGLDREGIRLLQNRLVNFKEKGHIIMISSHSFSDLDVISDAVIMIQDGKIVANSSYDAIKQGGFETLETFYKNQRK